MFTNKLKLSLSSILFATIIAVLLFTVPQSVSAQGTEGPQTYLTPESYATSLGATYRCYQTFYQQYGYARGMGGYIYYIKIYPYGQPNNVIVYKNFDPTGNHEYNYTLDDKDGTLCYELVPFEDLLINGKAKFTPGAKYTAEVEATYMQMDTGGDEWYCQTYTFYGTAVGLRMYADWNMDADFVDNVSSSTADLSEHINNYNYRFSYSDGRRIQDRWFYQGTSSTADACKPHIFYNDFTVPSDIKTGYFRMRYIVPYGYNYYSYSGYIYTITTNTGYYSNPNVTYTSSSSYFYDYGGVYDIIVGISVGISDMYPNDKEGFNQLFVNEDYNDENRQLATDGSGLGPFYEFPNPSFEIEEAMTEGTKVTFAIYGPYPNPALVYTGLDPNDGTANIDISASNFPGAVYPHKVNITSASGSYATNGGDGTFRGTQGGEYEVRLTITPPGKDSRELRKRFSMSLANDLAVMNINSPLRYEAPFYKQYPLGYVVKIQSLVKNVGLNPINKFEATATIYGPSDTEVFTKTLIYDSNLPENATLSLNDAVDMDFGDFISSDGIGQYRIDVTTTLLSDIDMSTYNNDYPRIGDVDYLVAVTSEYEAEPLYSVFPENLSNNVVINRPFRPEGQFINNGLSDIADAPAKMVFTLREDKSYSVESFVFIEELPSDVVGGRTTTFPFVTLNRPGVYDGVLIISVPDDANRENDTIRFVFTVRENIHEGTYVIGGVVAADYPTIEAAMNDLYLRGIDGPVVFELADENYVLGEIDSYFPAWDFSTKIIGVNEVNTITIRPSADMSLIPRGINITLNSAIGEGVRFGQNPVNRYLETAYINSRNISDDQRLEYANSAGHITFDGGENKSFVFSMFSGTKKSAAFALYQGSHDITIKDCIIENGQGSITSDFVPGTYFSALDGNVFESDFEIDNNNHSYTAGIISRAVIYNQAMNNLEGEGGEQAEGDTLAPFTYETIPNNNNTFDNNDIVGFGYGVMGIGLGPILVSDVDGNQYFDNYYSQNTEITNNTIIDCGKAGVFLGFEQNVLVANNIITGTGGTLISSGIEIGGRSHGKYLGYNNMDVTILNNRIAAVVGDVGTYGISVEQSHNGYPDPTYGIVSYPDSDDNIVIEGNAFWNLTGGAPETAISGIAVMAERDDYDFGTMKNTAADIKGIEIINNTVSIDYDTDGFTNGISLININDATVINNAVSLSNTTTTNDVNACLYYQSMLPADGGIESNYNVLYSSENVDAVRFVEVKQMMNDDDEIYVAFVNNSIKGEYATLRNWLAWTGSDKNSSQSTMNFMDDFILDEEDISIKTDVEFNDLSNRGLNLDGNHTDVYGVVRGQSDEYYDVGALEFNIKPLSVDYQALSITSPIAYKEAEGIYNDAEYLMVVDEGVTLSALIRNSGSNYEDDIPVTFYAYRFNYDLIDWELVLENTVYVTAGKDEFATATADVQLIPKTFSEEKWDAFITNNNWYGMEENVTPRYKIKVRVGYDLNDDNNEIENTYRFYMRRAFEYKVMQSNVSNTIDLTVVSGDDYAAAANAHAVNSALKDISIYNVSRLEALENFELGLEKDIEYRQDVDMLNRDGWPARSISYSGYKTVFYVDGNNSKFTRLDKIQLIDFINAGTNEKKHNFILSSEELVRNQLLIDWENGVDPDLDINGELRIEPRFPYSPLGLKDNFVDYNDFVDYSGNTVTGVTAGGGASFLIESTDQDIIDGMYPKPGLFNLDDDEYGFVGIGMIYDNVENQNFPEGGKIMSNVFTPQNRNVTVMGVDWRHYNDVNNLMRAAIDVMNSHGGMVNPVELFTFDGKQVGDRVELNWCTASENGASHFEVERSNSYSFIKVADVQATGNSNILAYYNATDNNVNIGETYTYRLKMVDNDGSYSYSKEITIEIDGSSLFEVTSINPNPVSTTARFDVTTTEASNVMIDLYNISGVHVTNIYNGNISGVKNFEINAANYPSGSYHVVIRSGEKATTLPVNIVR